MAKKVGAAKGSEQMEILAPADGALGFLARPPLLTTESRNDFDALLKALQREIKPKGVIEDMYVADIAYIIWEILRLRRCKTAIINAAYFEVLKSVIFKVSREPRTSTSDVQTLFRVIENRSRPHTEEEQKRENLLFDWFHDKKAKAELARKLAKFGLDESFIDGRAINFASEDLELLDEMLISLENRRDKCLRQIEAYRHGFAARVRASANQIIDAEHEDVLAPPRAPANTNSTA
jgi:hypothetical protein